MKSRIMYIEYKGESMAVEARIGRVSFSKSGKSVHYNGKTFQSLDGTGFKANYFDTENGDHYWISGCKRHGSDRLYGERLPIIIDEDVRVEYWTQIRKLPSMVNIRIINGRS